MGFTNLSIHTTIWKFPIEVTDRQIIQMPHGSLILNCQEQGTQLCIWAAVDPTLPKEDRIIRMIGTGHPIPKDISLQYIGTVQQHSGSLVWHIFEED